MAEPSAAAGNLFLATISGYLADAHFSEALEHAEEALQGPDAPHAVCAMAAVAFRQGNIAAAVSLLEPLAESMQGSSDVPEVLGVLNCLAGRVTEALYYGKLATALPPDHAVLPLFGPGFPRYADAFLGIGHKPLLRSSREAFDAGDYELSVQLAEQHLQLFPNDVEGLDRYAECLMAIEDFRTAISVLRSVMTLAGPSATLLSRLGQAQVALGQFQQGMACHRMAVTRGPKASVLWAANVLDWAYSPWGDCTASAEAVAGLSAAIAQAGPKVARGAPAAQVKPKLTIGFLCNAPRNDDSRTMIAAIARGFDRSAVTVVGFGPGELGDAFNVAYRGNFDRWRNTNKVDELTLSAVIRGEGIDVLIDADGLSARERLSLLSRNAAPLQFSWLNVPLSVAVPGATAHLGTAEDLASGIFLLPGGDGKATPLPAAQPDAPVTFGADVTMAELNVETVRVWSAILHAVPESMLVLADRGFQRQGLVDDLIAMFGNFGVAHRIDVQASATREEFFANVDVALAPFPVVRPAPYGVALAMGVPVIALAGDAFGFGNSLRCLGSAAPRMLAADIEHYQALALSWAGDLAGLAEHRRAAPLSLRQSVVFSAEHFCAEWERFFRSTLASLAAAEA